MLASAQTSHGLGGVHLLVLHDQMPHSRVGGRHAEKSMFEVDAIAAQGHVVHGTPGDQPHHQLDSFTARFVHVVELGDGSSGSRIMNQLVQKGVVKFFVDESGARALQRVAHAAGAPDVHVASLTRNTTETRQKHDVKDLTGLHPFCSIDTAHRLQLRLFAALGCIQSH